MTGSWRSWHALLAFLLIPVATVVVGRFLPSAVWAWIIIALLFAALFVVVGHGITALWHGLFIDERNAISLSRLQAVTWAVIILSAYVTAALVNLRLGRPDPLEVSIAGELWAIMGISATSLVAAPLLRQVKEQKRPRKETFAHTLRSLGYDVSVTQLGEAADARGLRVYTSPAAGQPAPPESRGIVVVKGSPADAAWSDIFRGEDTGNAAYLDLGKLQMFYFTLALVVAYAVAIGNAFANADDSGIAQMPALSEGVAVLLGISHAAYLVNKAVDRP